MLWEDKDHGNLCCLLASDIPFLATSRLARKKIRCDLGQERTYLFCDKPQTSCDCGPGHRTGQSLASGHSACKRGWFTLRVTCWDPKDIIGKRL